MMPSFAWQPGWVAWLILAAGCVAAAHAVVSYHRARHVARAGWLRVLLLLRLLAIASLVLAAFQPTLFLQVKSARPVSVVIMLDNSRSMGIVDTARSTPQNLRIAEAVGRLEPVETDRPTKVLTRQVRALSAGLAELRSVNAELADSKTSGRIDPQLQSRSRELLAAARADVAAMQASSREEASLRFAETKLKQIGEQLDPPRKDQPERLIGQLLDEVVRRDAEADIRAVEAAPAVRAVVEEIAQQSRFDLARQAAAAVYRSGASPNQRLLRTLDADIAPDAVVDLKPDAVRTPLLSALKQTVERSGASAIEAIVILTDGRSTEPSRSIPPLLSAAGVPVYPVLCAPLGRQPDVRVVSLDLPTTALVGERITATARLRAREADGRRVKVTLTDGNVTTVREVVLGGDETPVAFDLPAAAAPEVTVRVSVEPVPGETLVDNNAATGRVSVVDQKLRVMLVAGNAAWDVQYLRNILSRTPWIVLEDQFVIGGEPCRFSAEQIAVQDVIVLAGVSTGSLSPQQIDAIHRAVSEQSRSALLMGLSPGLLASYAEHPLLGTLVPQRIDQPASWRLAPADEPTIRGTPAPLASELPMLRLDASTDASLRRWLARPLMYRVLEVGRLKPQTTPLLVDRGTDTPLIVESVVGTGRSLTMLVDETWRWRRDEGGDAHDQFLLQLVRHLTEPPYNVTRDDLSLGVDRTRLVAGESLDLRARTDPSTPGSPQLQLRQGDRVIEQKPATSPLPGSGRWSGRLTLADPGAYQVVLQHAGRELAVDIQVLPDDQAEFADVAPDPALLQRLASATGGKMFTLEQLDQLAQRIASPPGERVDTIEYAVWSSPYLFAILVAFLGLEWALRKQIGLV